MGDLLGVVLTVDGEGGDEEAELQALIQRTRNALAGLELRTGKTASHKDPLLGEGSVAMREYSSTRQKKRPACAGPFNSFDPKGDFRPSP